MCYGMSCPHENGYSGECTFNGVGPFPCPGEDESETCAAAAPTSWLCPECQEDEYDAALWLSGDGEKYFCTMCKSEWTADKLPHAYTALLIILERARIDAVEDAEKARREADELRKKLEAVRRAAA